MKIFLSWAGEESRQLAIIFESWLKKTLQTSKPWMSTNISKGEGWDKEIHNGLNDTKIGILFLTKESIESKYLHYEAGAISNVPDSLVCTFLFDIKNTDVKQPLSRFQATQNSKEDVFKLISTINTKILALGGSVLDSAQLSEIFEIMWPILESKIKDINVISPTTIIEPIRTERDILEEILNIVREKDKGLLKQQVLEMETLFNQQALLRREWDRQSQEARNEHLNVILKKILKENNWNHEQALNVEKLNKIVFNIRSSDSSAQYSRHEIEQAINRFFL